MVCHKNIKTHVQFHVITFYITYEAEKIHITVITMSIVTYITKSIIRGIMIIYNADKFSTQSVLITFLNNNSSGYNSNEFILMCSF